MRKLLIVIAILTGLMLIPAGAALADAGTHASCMGHEASAISPKGSSDELPGGTRELNEFFSSLGVPQGQIVKLVASVHAGSHEACDEAFE